MRAFLRGIVLFIFGALAGGGLMAAAFSWHLVRTESGVQLMRNSKSHFMDCYADIRKWSASDWSQHSALATSLVDAGHGDLIVRSSADALVDELFDKSTD